MLIDNELCTGCGICVDYCPVDVIFLDREIKKAHIDLDGCVECGSCLRSSRCPADAIYQQELTWPRTIRSIMSDPLTITEESGIAGRGTEEMKTNDVTGRFKHGQVGFGIEMGRPILGTSMQDVEKVSMAVAKSGAEFEVCNPLTTLMSDVNTGKFKYDILNERVLTTIIEFNTPIEQLTEMLDVLRDVSEQIDTVFSISLASVVNADESIPTKKILDEAGIWYAPNGKTNVGLGRPLANIK